MHFLLGTTAKDLRGPGLAVDCLWCGKQTNAHSWQRVEWLTLFHILPVIPFKTVFVKCTSCDKDMLAACTLEELKSRLLGVESEFVFAFDVWICCNDGTQVL